MVVTEENFVFDNLYCMALCLAKTKDVSLSQVQRQLLGSLSGGIENVQNLPFNHNVRSALLATGIYVLHSNGQNVEPLTDYLNAAFSALPHVRWFDDAAVNKSDKVTIYEQFTFCFNTIISDISAHFPHVRDEVVKAQVDLMLKLTNEICSYGSYTGHSELENGEHADQTTDDASIDSKVDLMKLVSMLIGLVRSLGRFSSKIQFPLIEQIFPLPFKLKPSTGADFSELMKPSKLSTDVSNWFWNESYKIDSTTYSSVESMAKKVFSKHGSSFINDKTDFTSGSLLVFCFDEIRTITNCIKKLLNVAVLTRLDKFSCQVFLSAELRKFPYRTISETLVLVCLTLLKDILLPYSSIHDKETPIPDSFANEINSFVLEQFKRGQESIAQKSSFEDRRLITLHAGTTATHRNILDKDSMVNRVKMLVIANSVCLELIVWSAIDENDGDMICHMPVNVVALEALGGMAEKFPNLSNTFIIRLLCRFLLDPCPILVKLDDEKGYEKKLSRETNQREEQQLARRKAGMTSLRSAAMDSLTRALRSALVVDKSSVQACLAALSSRLYMVATEADNNSILVSENTIMTLGKIGVAFVDYDSCSELILQIFLQRFSNPPSSQDSLIIASLGNMWIAGTRSIYDGIMKLFTRVTIESSNRIYSPEPDNTEHKFSHVSLAVDNALARIASSLTQEEDKMTFLIRLFL
uniref:PI4-kinase N-terminal domain-containing protein n=1 Tax=Ditylenchus dipsaci TaxID=166011 RepID=A0A915CZ95_9BILA